MLIFSPLFIFLGQNVAFAQDDEVFTVEFYLGAAVFGVDDDIPDL